MLELLEARRLFAITLVGSELRLDGRTATSDSFEVGYQNATTIYARHSNFFTGTVYANRTFPRSAVNFIRADAGVGQDRVYLTASLDIPAFIDGGAGSDFLSGGTVPDTIHGGGGPDSIYGGDGNDVLRGQDGDDNLHGEGGNDLLDGGDGRDRLFGDAGSDSAVVDGEDTIDLGPGGNDGVLVHGTAGDDEIFVGRAVVNGTPQLRVRLNGVLQTTSVLGCETVKVIAFGGDDLVVMEASAAVTWKAFFLGYSGDDTLIGNARDDLLNGGSGDDLLLGRGGNDIFISGTVG